MKKDSFLLILLITLGFLSFLVLKSFLTYILISIILTAVSYPLYEKIKSKVRYSSLSATILILFLALIIILPSIYLTIAIFSQARDIVLNIGAADFNNLQRFEDNLESFFGAELNFAENMRVFILELSTNLRFTIIQNIVIFTKTLANFLAGTALMFFVMYYLFIDGKRIVAELKKNFPIEDKYKDYLFNRTYHTIQGLFMGLFSVAILQGLLAGIAYFIFGMPNAILFGFITGVFSLIPFLGPPVIYIPVSIFLILSGNILGGIALLAFSFIVISNIDNFIRPMVVRFKSKVHPLYVILGVVGGVAFLGFSGIIIGPLILSLFQEVVSVYQLAKKENRSE